MTPWESLTALDALKPPHSQWCKTGERGRIHCYPTCTYYRDPSPPPFSECRLAAPYPSMRRPPGAFKKRVERRRAKNKAARKARQRNRR